MGNIDGETIVSDQGNIFHITETLFSYDLSKFESGRVMLSCDVLKKTSENNYDVRLTGISGVLIKNVKTMADSTPEEDLAVNDPVLIRELWYSGGYINMTIEVAFKNESKTHHYINLIREESSEDGKYTFTLRHNAQGEVPTEEDRNHYTGSIGYVSFPVSELIKGDKAKITFNWKTHKFTGSGYSLVETEETSKEFNWERGSFEQAPKTLAVRSSVILN